MVIHMKVLPSFQRLLPEHSSRLRLEKPFIIQDGKMGYCLAPKKLMDEFRKVHQYNVFSVNHPIQKALSTYLKTPSNYNELGGFFQKKRDSFLYLIKDSRFRIIPSKGTYFQLLDFSEISLESDIAFAERLTIDNKLATIPTSVL